MSRSVFDLRLADPTIGPLDVLQWSGEEGISKLFRFDVDVFAPPGADLLATSILGMGARFSFGAPTRRVVRGVVGRVTALGVATRWGEPVYRVRVVPPQWMGKRRVSSTVFQRIPLSQIVQSVSASTGGAVVAKLLGQDPVREYCVQYRESDWAFTKRILAGDGVLFYFAAAEDDDDDAGAIDPARFRPDALVLADHAASYSQLGAPLVRIDPWHQTKEDAQSFHSVHTVRPNEMLLKDYNFQRPLQSLQEAAALRGTAGALHEPDASLRVYSHRGEYLDAEVTPANASRHLEQLRRRAWEGNGESRHNLLAPGHRFQLEVVGQTSAGGEHVITRIRHRGVAPERAEKGAVTYENTFSSVRSDVPFRPKRPSIAPRQVLESAVVVGPQPGTVFTDALGRVRVQFHWDLNGNMDENSTAWLRVVQGWAGPSFGWQFIPRVGMEVMVSFLGGDPDCPVVLGAVYNVAAPHPFGLGQATATRSGLKTQSTPGGDGYNEISFEDASGAEQIFVRAQRDLDEEIKRNHTLVVDRSETVKIKDDQALSVGGDKEEEIGGSSRRLVGEDDLVEVKGSRSTAVTGNDVATTENERRARVGTNDRLDVEGAADWTIDEDLTLRVHGSHATIVGKPEAQRSYALHVEGTADLSSHDMMEISSKKGIRLRCGETVVEIMKDRVELVSPKLTLRSPSARVAVDGDTLELFAKTTATLKSDRVSMGSVDALITMLSEIKAQASRILLNSPDKATDPPEEPPDPPTVIRLADEDGKPLANARVVLVIGDGDEHTERTIVLDEDGRAEVHDLDAVASIRFPGLVDARSD